MTLHAAPDQAPLGATATSLPSLVLLLCGLFSTYREFCRFLYHLPNHHHIEYDLPGHESSASLADLLFLAVVTLERRGMLDKHFFSALADKFPARIQQIQDQAHARGIPPAHVTSRQVITNGLNLRSHLAIRTSQSLRNILAGLSLFTAAFLTWWHFETGTPSLHDLKSMTDKLEHSKLQSDLQRRCRDLANPGDEVRIEYHHDTQGGIAQAIAPYHTDNPPLVDCTIYHTSDWRRQWSFGKSGIRSVSVTFPQSRS